MIKGETEKALLIEFDAGQEVWIPKNVSSMHIALSGCGTFTRLSSPSNLSRASTNAARNLVIWDEDTLYFFHHLNGQKL